MLIALSFETTTLFTPLRIKKQSQTDLWIVGTHTIEDINHEPVYRNTKVSLSDINKAWLSRGESVHRREPS